MYPGLAYIERVAMKPDVIPLRFPVDSPAGGKVTEVVVTKGQVSSSAHSEGTECNR